MKKADLEKLLTSLFETESIMLEMSKEIDKGVKSEPERYKAIYKKE